MNKTIKLLLYVLLIGLPIYLVTTLYYLDKQYFLCPIHYNWNKVIRSDARGDGYFAARRNGHRAHNGIDLMAEVGTPVMASRCGRALTASQPRGMGNYVIIRHANNLSTLYGHLLRIEVRNGSLVRQGEVIGRTGKTGNAGYPGIQPHLHFEVRKDGILQDPLEYLE